MGDTIQRRVFGKAVGDQSLTGLSLPSGYQIAGLAIDNYSGSWLYVPQIATYVPPSTIGWATPIGPMVAEVDVTYVDGPAGSISDPTGQPAAVTLYSTPIAASPGQLINLGRTGMRFLGIIDLSGTNFLDGIALSPNEQTIIWNYDQALANSLVAVTCTGETTGIPYGSSTGDVGKNNGVIPVNPSADPTVSFIANSILTYGKVYLYAYAASILVAAAIVGGTLDVVVQPSGSSPISAVSAGFTTSPTPNVSVVSTVVAAPAAGTHLRIRACSLSWYQSNTSTAIIQASGYDGTASFSYTGLSAQTPGAALSLPPEGYDLPSQTAFVLVHRCNVASQILDLACLYQTIADL